MTAPFPLSREDKKLKSIYDVVAEIRLTQITVVGAIVTTYIGTNGDDEITGSSGSDSIYGLDGNDILKGGDGADHIEGGAGNDFIAENLGNASDFYSDTLLGGDGDDTILAGLGDNIDGGNGNDTLSLRLDNASGGFNIDFTTLWLGATFVIDGATIQHIENPNYIIATQFDDFITLGTPAGKAGTLMGFGGNDTLTGGDGNDTLNADGSVTAFGETYHDVMTGGNGDDYLVGGIGDYFDGGAGTDRISFDMSSNASGVNVTLGSITLGGSVTILGTQFVDIEHIDTAYGTAFDDTIGVVGDSYGSTLHGEDGNDTLVGWNGADTLDGGTGADTMSGGKGNDNYYVDNGSDVVTEVSGQGNDTVNATISYTLPDNVEQLLLWGSSAINGTGNDLANVIFGNPAHNVLTGGLGNDTIQGYGGDDVVKGGDGADALWGGDGDDTVQGSTGADTLSGGTGQDTLSGGSGTDKFTFDDGDFSGTTTATADLITDFKHAQGDLIDLHAVDAVTVGSDNAFTFLGTGAFTGVAGQLHYAFDGAFTLVSGDTNGDGVADFAVALNGNISLVAADFVL